MAHGTGWGPKIPHFQLKILCFSRFYSGFFSSRIRRRGEKTPGTGRGMILLRFDTPEQREGRDLGTVGEFVAEKEVQKLGLNKALMGGWGKVSQRNPGCPIPEASKANLGWWKQDFPEGPSQPKPLWDCGTWPEGRTGEKTDTKELGIPTNPKIQAGWAPQAAPGALECPRPAWSNLGQGKVSLLILGWKIRF